MAARLMKLHAAWWHYDQNFFSSRRRKKIYLTAFVAHLLSGVRPHHIRVKTFWSCCKRTPMFSSGYRVITCYRRLRRTLLSCSYSYMWITFCFCFGWFFMFLFQFLFLLVTPPTDCPRTHEPARVDSLIVSCVSVVLFR